MTKEIRTNDLPVAQAIATPYQRELLARIPEDELAQVAEFAYPQAVPAGEDLGPLELRVGQRTLTLPTHEPGLVDTLEQMAENPQMYARMWARLYVELMDTDSYAYVRRRMDAIAAEEAGLVRGPAGAGQLLLGHHEGGRRDIEAEETCPSCRLPGGFHDDACQSPEARERRGLEPIRPAPGRRS